MSYEVVNPKYTTIRSLISTDFLVSHVIGQIFCVLVISRRFSTLKSDQTLKIIGQVSLLNVSHFSDLSAASATRSNSCYPCLINPVIARHHDAQHSWPYIFRSIYIVIKRIYDLILPQFGMAMQMSCLSSLDLILVLTIFERLARVYHFQHSLSLIIESNFIRTLALFNGILLFLIISLF